MAHHASLGPVSFPAFPVLPTMPSVKQLIPFTPWPVWSMEDEKQLLWTDLEKSVYSDPQYGPTNRIIVSDAPLPTALHSWGNALYACPCLCRATGRSPQTLRAGGLRGIGVEAGWWPHHTRHIHPKGVAIVFGLPSFRERVSDDCRAQLCLYGKSVSPLQVLWIWGHIWKHVGLTPSHVQSSDYIADYVEVILQQRDVFWPSPCMETFGGNPPWMETSIFRFPKTIGFEWDSTEVHGTSC